MLVLSHVFSRITAHLDVKRVALVINITLSVVRIREKLLLQRTSFGNRIDSSFLDACNAPNLATAKDLGLAER